MYHTDLDILSQYEYTILTGDTDEINLKLIDREIFSISNKQLQVNINVQNLSLEMVLKKLCCNIPLIEVYKYLENYESRRRFERAKLDDLQQQTKDQLRKQSGVTVKAILDAIISIVEYMSQFLNKGTI